MKIATYISVFFISLGANIGFAQISTFPYSEGFEGSFGAWTNVTGDDFNWTRYRNGTPSNNTGPSSGNNGSTWYVYVEASSPNYPIKQTFLEATFDFTNVEDPQLSFYYHMFGSDIGSLHIDVNDGTWNTDVWTISGQQQTSSSDTWGKAEINLAAYGNTNNVTVRIRGLTGASWAGDITIDDMYCYDKCSSIATGTSTISANALCGAGTVDLSVFGHDGTAAVQWQQSTDNSTFSNLAGGTTANFTTPSLTAGSTYFFRVQLTKTCAAFGDTVSVVVASGAGAATPYNNGFEASLGGWSNIGGDDFDWTRNQGGTPSNGTGPSTGSEGAWYMYTEASNPNNPSKRTELIQAFDFSSLTSPEMNFYYHMFGANMGELNIDINGTPAIYTVSGQQQTANAAPWKNTTINLSAYASQSCVVVKFRGITGTGWSSDIAIDDITICDSYNTGTTTAPSEVLCGSGTSNLSISGHDAGATLQWQMSLDNITFTNIGGATSTSYLSRTLNPDSSFYFRVQLTKGCIKYSDTTTVVVASVGGATIPYTESFEASLGAWTNATTDDFDWTRNQGGTPSTGTGPSTGSNSAWYLYTEASGANNPSKMAIIQTTFDFSGTTNPQLSFDYHMFGTGMGTFYVDINGTEGVSSITGQQQISNADAWKTSKIDMTTYAGQSCVVVKFRGITGASWSSDIAFDNIQICDKISVGTTTISSNSLCGSGTVNLSVTGQDAGATLLWQMSVDNINFTNISGATGASYTSRVLNPDSSFYFRVAVTNTCTDYGNTVSVSAGFPGGNTPPYTESFEAGIGAWIQPTDDDFDWTRNQAGTPSTGTGPSVAQNGVWYMYAEASNPNFPTKKLRLEQTFDLSAATNPELSFYYHMYGAAMGTLAVDVNTTQNVWSISGQQQTSNADAWILVTVNLSTFAGQSCVTIKFKGETGNNFTSDMAIDNIALCDKPQTSAITGFNSVCTNDLGKVYSVSNTLGSTYNWLVTGGTIAGGQGTNTATINWGATGGADSVMVIEDNGCKGDTVSYTVAVNSVPVDTILGDLVVAENSLNEVYSITTRSGYTYNWVVTGGLNDPNPKTGQGTGTITMDWGLVTAGSIKVDATTACGTSSYTAPVTVFGYIQSVALGNWNQPATWSCGCIPGITDNVQINAGHTVTLTGAEQVNNLIIVSGGTVDNNGNILTLDGDYQVNGTHTGDGTANSRIVMQGVSAQIGGTGIIQNLIQLQLTTANKEIKTGTNLMLNNTNIRLYDGITVTNNGSITVAKNIDRMTGTPNWTNGANSSLTIAGNFVNVNSTVNASAINNTITYNGNSNQNVHNATYYNLTLSGSGTKTAVGIENINGVLTINSIYNVGNNNINLAGNLINNGTYSSGTNTITFDGNTTISGTSNLNFNHVNISGGLTASTQTNISGNWTNAGTFTHGSGKVTFNGTSLQSISGATTFNNLDLDNSFGVTTLSAISTEGIVTIFQGNLTLSDTLTLTSTASNTASIATIPSGSSVIGNVTMQRYINGADGWKSLASCIVGGTINDWGDDIYNAWAFEYDETLPDTLEAGWVGPAATSVSIAPGKGILAYTYAGVSTLDVTGTVHQGNINFGITYTDDPLQPASQDGWNLLGNPYPSTMDWDHADWTKTNINGAVYVWNGTAQQFTSYVGGVGTNGGTNLIASSQAFWVQSVAASPVLSATEAVKSNSSATFFKAKQQKTLKIKIASSTIAYTDETLLVLDENATNLFDKQYDAIKFYTANNTAPSIATQDSIKADYSINSFKKIEEGQTIPLKVKVGISGTYSLSLEGVAYLNVSCLTIEDLFTGDIQPILKDTSYSYSFQDTTTIARFLIHLGATPKIDINSVSCNGLNDGKITVTGPAIGPWNYFIRDSIGNTVEQSLAANSSLEVQNISGGNYTIEIENVNTNCKSFSVSIVVEEPSKLTPSPLITNPLCVGANNGIVQLTLNGGSSPYSYIWSNQETTSEITNLRNKYYFVTITDANNCKIQESYLLTSPQLINTQATLQNAVCFGQSNGKITILPKGGTAPYQTTWNGNIIHHLLDSIPAGNYNFIVSDANNCTNNFIYTINEPTEIVSSFIIPDTVEVNETFDITNTTIGANDFVWDFGNGIFLYDENPTFSYTEAGEYLLSLQSSYNNCSDEIITTQIVVVPSIVTSIGQKNTNLVQIVTLMPNPAQVGEIVHLKLSRFSILENVLVVVRDITGKELYSKVNITNQNGNSLIAIDLDNNLASGIYLITGTSNNFLFNKRLIVK